MLARIRAITQPTARPIATPPAIPSTKRPATAGAETFPATTAPTADA